MSDKGHDHKDDHKVEPNVGFVELTVFKDQNERAVIRRTFQSQKPSYDEIFDVAKSEFGKKRELADFPEFRKKPPTDLSIPIEHGDDDVTYLIRLNSCTRAAFGPGPHPIMIMPMTLGRELLSDIALVYEDSEKNIVRMTQNNIPHEYSEVPKNAALSFRCNRSKLIAAWTAIVNNAGHLERNFRIPFFLNLFDTKTGKPVWTYGEGYHRAPKKDRFHGGIHPQTVTQFLYYP